MVALRTRSLHESLQSAIQRGAADAADSSNKNGGGGGQINGTHQNGNGKNFQASIPQRVPSSSQSGGTASRRSSAGSATAISGANHSLANGNGAEALIVAGTAIKDVEGANANGRRASNGKQSLKGEFF